MKKALVALATVAALAAATIAIPNPADASSSGRRLLQGIGIGVGAAVLFGAAARASIDPRWHGYAPAEGYYYYPGYAAAPAAPCPGGFWGARVVGRNQFGQPIYGNPRWVCPPQGYTYSNYYYR